MDVGNRLKEARIASGEDLTALGKRIGVRQEHLRAIEDGRLGDLPRGIYGRAAVRSFATAMGLDGPALLAECEPFLAPLEEPIAGLARVHGIRERPASVARPGSPSADRDHSTDDLPFAGWRPLAAAVVDASAIALLLLLVVVAAMTVLTAPPAALRSAGGAFAVMGALIAAGYYGWFGGVAGATCGERALAVEPHRVIRGAVTLRLACERAALAASQDVRWIQRAGERIGRSTGAWTSGITGEVKG
jgi:hypothetical protein